MNNNVLVVFVALAVVATGVALIAKPVTVNTPVTITTPEQSQSYGAVSGPSIDGSCFTVGGVTKCSTQMAFRAATTTVCSLRSPAATSTLEKVIANVRINVAHSQTYELAKATTQFATTTNIAYLTVASSKYDTLAVSTSTDYVVSPNTYFNFGVSTSTGTSIGSYFAPKGTCAATFQLL